MMGGVQDAGSIVFKKLMMDGKYAEAMDIARKQHVDDAHVIYIHVDDGLLVSLAVMQKFVMIAVTEPETAKKKHAVHVGQDQV